MTSRSWVLGLNTASDVLGVALADPERVHAELYVATERRNLHSERLMRAIDDLCRLSGVRPAELAGFSVAVGPGGFTGVRTALAAAKAMALSLSRPLIGVSTLEALADQAPGTGLVSPLVDARGEMVFTALYRKQEVLEVVRPPELVSLDDWLERLGSESLAFIGDGALKHADRLGGRWPCGRLEPTDHLLRAGSVARLGARRVAAGEGSDPHALLPLYMRAPSAIAKWEGA